MDALDALLRDAKKETGTEGFMVYSRKLRRWIAVQDMGLFELFESIHSDLKRYSYAALQYDPEFQAKLGTASKKMGDLSGGEEE